MKLRNVPFGNPDIQEIKTGIKNYLKSQDYWKDYDFDATGLDLLVSTLAISGYQDAFNANTSNNEAFLDSAFKRDSVVSRAKELGYTPKSITAAKVSVDVLVTENQEPLSGTLLLDKGSIFYSHDEEDSTIQFITTETLSITPANGEDYIFENVELSQGFYNTTDFVVDKSDKNQRFILPSDQIDTSLMEVYVQEGVSTTQLTKYTLADDLFDLDENSKVYFLQESEGGRFEIYFGDDILSKDVEHGKIVRVIYFVTNGETGNNLSKFTFSRTSKVNNMINRNNVSVNSYSKSYGGSSTESISSIKFNAPKAYKIRERSVQKDDNSFIIKNKYPEIKSVKSWDSKTGEYPYDNKGTVYVALNPYNPTSITDNKKDEIMKYLEDEKGVAPITYTWVNPNFVYIIPSFTVKIDRNQVEVDVDQVEYDIKTAITLYSEEELESFNKDFEYSNFLNTMESSSESIDSIYVTVKLEYRLAPTLNVSQEHEFTFNNPIKSGSISTNSFSYQNQTVYFDDVDGILRMYKIVNNLRVSVKDAGTVDYETGKVLIQPAIIVQAIDNADGYIKIKADPTDYPIVSKSNYILVLDKENSTINTSIT